MSASSHVYAELFTLFCEPEMDEVINMETGRSKNLIHGSLWTVFML